MRCPSNASDLPEEAQRQQAVEDSGLFQRGNDAALQRIVEAAARSLNAPIAAISVIDRDRQWFVAQKGLPVSETPRSHSFCAHAIHRPGEPLIVFDATRDIRFATNPLVLGDPRIRFYAGMPIVSQTGYPLGALCVIDTKPRVHVAGVYDLRLLAREAERLIAR